MNKISYFEKLKDPRWQRKRLEAMESKDFTCESCGDSESTLNVHHKAYFKSRDPWEYEINQLNVLCASCHENEHSKVDHLKLICSTLPIEGPQGKDEIAFLIAGYIGVDLHEYEEKTGLSYPHLRILHNIGSQATNVFWSLLRNDCEANHG